MALKTSGEIELKRKLIEATDAVRKKFNMVKNRNISNKFALEKFYEPTAKPLKNISEAAEEVKNRMLSTSQLPLKSEDISPPKQFKISKSASEEEFNQQYASYGTPQHTRLLTPPDTSSSAVGSPSAISTPSTSSGSSEFAKHLSYVEDLRANASNFDTVYGIRIDPNTNKLLMGDAEVRFSGNNMSLWRAGKKLKSFVGNSELYDLLFLKRPQVLSNTEKSITEDNLHTYGDILKLTNATYKNYNIKFGKNECKSKKYLKVIKPLMSHPMVRRSKFNGSGVNIYRLPTKKVVTHNTKDYVYWNKPKELIARLRLLWSSKMAGHTGHDNEIMSIIEELREEGIVL